MRQNNHQGAVPNEIDVRLRRRDTAPLPPGALLRFQSINRGKNPDVNYRWLLYEDGRWFLARHSGDTSDWQTPFDTELPAAPTRQLSTDVVASIRDELQKADFLGQPPYQADLTVEDGGFDVVTARIGGQVHEVIYEAVDTALLEFLREIIRHDE